MNLELEIGLRGLEAQMEGRKTKSSLSSQQQAARSKVGIPGS